VTLVAEIKLLLRLHADYRKQYIRQVQEGRSYLTKESASAIKGLDSVSVVSIWTANNGRRGASSDAAFAGLGVSPSLC
jgi:hypothetical protein